jgi:hypothetical protein
MISRWEKRLEIVENSLKRYSERRKKNIYHSLLRPLYQEILKSIFIIIIMITDTFILLEIILILDIPINIIIFFILGFIIFYIELKIYNSLWGKNGKWSIEKYKKNKKE